VDAPTQTGGAPVSPANPGGERGGSASLFLRLRRVLFLALWAWFLLGLYLRAHGREPFFALLAPGFDAGGPAPGTPATYSTLRFFLPGERRADGTVGRAEEIPVASVFSGLPFAQYNPTFRRLGVEAAVQGKPVAPNARLARVSAWLLSRAAAVDPRAAAGLVVCQQMTNWNVATGGEPKAIRASLACRPWSKDGPTGSASKEQIAPPTFDEMSGGVGVGAAPGGVDA